jgi:hypothetical protein
MGAYSKYKKLFLNFTFCNFYKAFAANYFVEYSIIAIALFGANKTLFSIP